MPLILSAAKAVVGRAVATASPRSASAARAAPLRGPSALRHGLVDAPGRQTPTRRAVRRWATPPDSELPAPLESASSSSASDASAAEASTASSLPGVRIDLGLPRRSRLVAFTCNKCDTRTERMVNPRAWESGLVFVQCGDPGCGAWHKIADAAGLVEEIRFDTEDAPLAAVAAAALEFEGGEEPHGLVVKGVEPGAILPTQLGGEEGV